VGKTLAAWLNSEPRNSAAFDHIIGLVKPMQLLGSPMRGARRKQSADVIFWQAQADRGLEHYLIRPSVAPAVGNGRWELVDNNRRTPPHPTPVVSGGIHEADAAALAFHLFQSGLIHRLRACGLCGQWFFAVAGQEKFCRKSCQKKRYTSTEQWREHRARYMREYRAKRYVEKLLK